MATVRIEDVTVDKGDAVLLDRVSLEVHDGELMVVLGPSGAGKSTLLRAVAGLDAVTTGAIWIGGEEVTQVPTSRRRLAMVFQDNALFPFMDVRRNISFPLRIAKVAPGEIADRVTAEARVLAIEHLLERMPGHLSAGHQQLVQAARALVRVPQVFLMDEPLVRLDAQIRALMRRELRLLQQGYGVTTLYVSNDPEEAMAVADRMAVLIEGKVVQVGSPLELYHRPASSTVAALVGVPPMTIVPGRVTADPPGFWVEIGPLRIRAWAPALASARGPVEVGVRPEDVVIDPGGVEVTVVGVEHFGSHSQVALELQRGLSLVMRSGQVPPQLFTNVRVRVEELHVFDASTGSAIAHVESRQAGAGDG